MRRAQLGEPLTGTPSDLGVLDGPGEQFDDLVVSPELDEVLERQVDRPGHRSGGAQVAKLVALSLTAGHAITIDPAPDAPLHSD